MRIRISQAYQIIASLAIMINGLGFVIRIGGINIVNIFTILAFVLMVIYFVSDRRAIAITISGKKKYYLLFFSLWVVYGFFINIFNGAFTNEYGTDVYRQLLTNYIFVFFVCCIIRDKNGFDLVRNIMYVDLVINIGLGLFEIITGYHFVEAESVWNQNMPRTFHGNPNEYATTLFCVLVCLFFFASEIRKSIKLALVFFLALLCIYETDCRGILYAVIIFLLCYGFMQGYTKLKLPREFLKYLIIIGFGVLLIVIVLGKLDDILSWVVSWISSGSDQESDIKRIGFINKSIELLKESYYLGGGSGQSIKYIGMNPHNLIAEILAEYGLPIFIPLVYFFWKIWRAAFEGKHKERIRSMYFAIIPSVLMASVVSSSILKFKMFWIFLLMLYIYEDYKPERTNI